MINVGIMSDNNIKLEAYKETQEEFEEVLNTLASFKSQITMLANQMKSLQKNVKKKIKSLEKEIKKSKSKGNKKPSGFAAPRKISAKLCKFMNKPEGSEAARTEVTRYIIQYIRDKNLQNPINKKEIDPDSALKSLLGNNIDEKTGKKEVITYFNIQRHMNKHFEK